MFPFIILSFLLGVSSELVPFWLLFACGVGPFWYQSGLFLFYSGSVYNPVGVYGGVLCRKSCRVGPKAGAVDGLSFILRDFGRSSRLQGVPKWWKNCLKRNGRINT